MKNNPHYMSYADIQKEAINLIKRFHLITRKDVRKTSLSRIYDLLSEMQERSGI